MRSLFLKDLTLHHSASDAILKLVTARYSFVFLKCFDFLFSTTPRNYGCMYAHASLYWLEYTDDKYVDFCFRFLDLRLYVMWLSRIFSWVS